MWYLGNINITVWFFVFLCWNFVIQFFIHKLVYYTALVFIFKFCRRISHNLKNQEQTNFDLLLQRFSLSGFPQNGKTEYSYVYVLPNISMPLFLIAQSNIKYFSYPKSQQVTGTTHEFQHVSFSQHVSGLSNWCTFELTKGSAGRFISCYWVSWIGFGICPSRELVWHLITQVNNGLLAVYITVFDLRRGNRRCIIPFMVYALVYLSIASNLVTLDTLSTKSYSVYTHNCSPFSRKPLLRWSRMVETGLLII